MHQTVNQTMQQTMNDESIESLHLKIKRSISKISVKNLNINLIIITIHLLELIVHAVNVTQVNPVTSIRQDTVGVNNNSFYQTTLSKMFLVL